MEKSAERDPLIVNYESLEKRIHKISAEARLLSFVETPALFQVVNR